MKREYILPQDAMPLDLDNAEMVYRIRLHNENSAAKVSGAVRGQAGASCTPPAGEPPIEYCDCPIWGVFLAKSGYGSDPCWIHDWAYTRAGAERHRAECQQHFPSSVYEIRRVADAEHIPGCANTL